MNLNLLENNTKDIFYIKYDEINKISEVAKKIGLENKNDDIYDSIFKGNNIHRNHPLSNNSKDISFIKNKLNLIFLNSLILKRFNFIIPHEVGSKSTLSSNFKGKDIDDVNNEYTKTKVKVKQKPLYDYFNKEIYIKLNKRIK